MLQWRGCDSGSGKCGCAEDAVALRRQIVFLGLNWKQRPEFKAMLATTVKKFVVGNK